jgi:hypothetical protein
MQSAGAESAQYAGAENISGGVSGGELHRCQQPADLRFTDTTNQC